ncbi:hypothetical protein [Lentilactobacillus kisonensis]|uniref:Uncharacterized protein n=3 Tax=Lentilactobacillus kisonensis TaxID=481722 RepID=H1LE52_9LACO|nr:hypothetical protein [Lentilactobacillus kisonensis]EHO52738.1 hypothetical protein HMPREF9104_00878 [Lentilactobacillus kisonensis F0435]
MASIAKWLATYTVSLFYALIFWVFSRSNASGGASGSTIILNVLNLTNAGVLFPVSSMWLRKIFSEAGYHSGLDALPMDMGNGATYFSMGQNDHSAFVPKGIDTALFKNAESLLIYLVNYILALPLFILLTSSKLFKWQLFERLVLFSETHRYKRNLKNAKFIAPIDLAGLTATIDDHREALLFIGSPNDVLSRKILPALAAIGKLNTVTIDYFDASQASNEQYQTILSKLNLYTLPSQLPVLVEIHHDGSISPIEFNHLAEVVRLWAEGTGR